MLDPIGIYDFPPYRPPNEACSGLIRITRGCPWNKCEFCDMYKGRKFEKKSLDEIKADVLKARKIYGPIQTIFLGDSDNLVHNDMPEIVKFIRKTFPEVERVTAYARAKTVLRRSIDFLKATRAAGLDRLHIGLESGDPVVLKRMRKGSTPEEMIGGAKKAKEAGFEFSLYVLSGAGSLDRWKEHAINSAKVCNEAEPDFIRLRTLTIQRNTPLRERLESGEFIITPPLERLKETGIFIEMLTLEGCYLASDHVTNYLWADGVVFYPGVAGHLQKERKKMLETIRKAIDFVESNVGEIKDSNQLYDEGHIMGL